jgi:hypothetical protein
MILETAQRVKPPTARTVALNFIHTNFARIDMTLRITPEMAAGLSDSVWSYEEIAGLA